MTLKNAVTKGVKAWRDRRVGYWLCIDPKTGEYYLLTSAALAELNGLKAMYRLPAVYYRIVLTRDWNVKLGPHVIGNHLDTSAYTVTIYSYSELSEEAKTTAYKAFEADNRRTLDAFCEVTEYLYDAYCYEYQWTGDKEIKGPELEEYVRHRLALFDPTGLYLDETILGDVVNECLTAFFSACCEFADFAKNNEFEFYENGICIRHR